MRFCFTVISTVTMNNFNKIKLSSSRSDVQKTLTMLNDLITRKGGRGWIRWLLKVVVTLRGGNSAALARSAYVATLHFHKLYKNGGKKLLVL